MKILFDQGVPVPLRQFLRGHEVVTAFEREWHELKNGDLLDAAAADGFGAIVTTDQNLRYQQRLTDRPGIIVLMTTDWRRIKRRANDVAAAIADLAPGVYVELTFPHKDG